MIENISELFDYVDEIVIAEQTDACSSAEIKELTMNKIHAEQKHTRKHPVWRTLLIAAVVAVVLAVGALAVYYGTMSGRKAEIQGEPVYIYEDDPTGKVTTATLVPDAEPTPRVILNMMGYEGSPEYEAFAEWENWLSEYDVIAQMHAGNFEDHPDLPQRFTHYGVANDEMAAKLDEIAEKYGLRLHERMEGFETAEGLYDILGTEPFLPTENIKLSSGYIYEDGTFKCETLLENGAFLVSFVQARGSITHISTGFPEEYEEWAYRTESGITVDLVLSDYAAYILAEFDGGVMTVCYSAGTKGGYWEDNVVMTREEYVSSLPSAEMYWTEEELDAMYEEYYNAAVCQNEDITATMAAQAIDEAGLTAIADSIDFAVLAERFQ